MRLTYCAFACCLLGCSSSSHPSSSASDGGLDAPSDGALSAVPDLRFAWVDAFSAYTTLICTNIETSDKQTTESDYVWTPLALGSADFTSDGGATGDGGVEPSSWEGLVNFTPVANIGSVTALATSGYASSMTSDLSTLIQNHQVITSLDMALPFSTGVYGAVASGPAAGASYSGAATFTGPRSGLDAWAASQGQISNVVTALTNTPTGLVAYSFGRTGDSNIYETLLADATSSTLAPQASALAQAGYIITAMGRSSSMTVVLVGTRVQGTSTPHTANVATATANVCSAITLQGGFTVVGTFATIMGSSVQYQVVTER